MSTATVMRRRSASHPFGPQPCSGWLDGDTQSVRSLAHALVEAQQSQANDRGSRNEKRCEVDGIERPNRVTGKRLTRAIDYLGRDSQYLPMSSSRDEVRSTVGGFGLRQFLECHRHRRTALPLSGWQELRHDFSPIGDQDALPQTHPAKVLAQLVLEITDADGFHPRYCSHSWLHRQ